MKKVYGKLTGAFMAYALATISILTLVGCGIQSGQDQNDNYGYNGYNNNSNGYYPYNNRYLLMRSNNQGQTEYANVDRPLNSNNPEQDVAQYHRSARFQPMDRNQAIDQRRGYETVDNNRDGMYFIEHKQNQYQDPYQGGQRQSSFWYNNYRYACGYNTGYWGYRGYCNYNNWNHIYAPYRYNWYNNWFWRPTYYNANNFWYYAPGWNNYIYYAGYYYYYFWIP